SPLVSSRPTSSLTSASLISSACASVLIAMNSTPLSHSSIMRLTALTPPPPIPTTLITARWFCGAATRREPFRSFLTLPSRQAGGVFRYFPEFTPRHVRHHQVSPSG